MYWKLISTEYFHFYSSTCPQLLMLSLLFWLVSFVLCSRHSVTSSAARHWRNGWRSCNTSPRPRSRSAAFSVATLTWELYVFCLKLFELISSWESIHVRTLKYVHLLHFYLKVLQSIKSVYINNSTCFKCTVGSSYYGKKHSRIYLALYCTIKGSTKPEIMPACVHDLCLHIVCNNIIIVWIYFSTCSASSIALDLDKLHHCHIIRRCCHR